MLILLLAALAALVASAAKILGDLLLRLSRLNDQLNKEEHTDEQEEE